MIFYFPHPTKNGFTLIELLVALTVFSIGVLGLFSAMGKALKVIHECEIQSRLASG